MCWKWWKFVNNCHFAPVEILIQLQPLPWSPLVSWSLWGTHSMSVSPRSISRAAIHSQEEAKIDLSLTSQRNFMQLRHLLSSVAFESCGGSLLPLLFSCWIASFVTPWTGAHQDLLSMGFARQEYWSGLPFLLLGDLPDSGMEPLSPELAGGFFSAEPPLKSLILWSEVAQSCLTLCDPMDCSLPGSSIHSIFQTRVLEWVAISFSRGSSQPRDRTQVSCITGRCFTLWATRESLVTPLPEADCLSLLLQGSLNRIKSYSFTLERKGELFPAWKNILEPEEMVVSFWRGMCDSWWERWLHPAFWNLSRVRELRPTRDTETSVFKIFFFFNYCVSFSSWSRSLVLFIHCDWFSQMQQSRIL